MTAADPDPVLLVADAVWDDIDAMWYDLFSSVDRLATRIVRAMCQEFTDCLRPTGIVPAREDASSRGPTPASLDRLLALRDALRATGPFVGQRRVPGTVVGTNHARTVATVREDCATLTAGHPTLEYHVYQSTLDVRGRRVTIHRVPGGLWTVRGADDRTPWRCLLGARGWAVVSSGDSWCASVPRAAHVPRRCSRDRPSMRVLNACRTAHAERCA